MNEERKTIKSSSFGELKILGSRFTGNAFPVSNKKEVDEFLISTIKKYHDATHNPFAYKLLLEEKENIRTSDDKEPQGTAGIQILFAIEKLNLWNILVIVTRYFGGKKLGRGGLMRAYRDCAEITLNNTKVIEIILYKKINFEFSHNDTGNVMKIISDFNGKIIHQVYKEKCNIVVKIPINYVEDFKNKLSKYFKSDNILIKS